MNQPPPLDIVAARVAALRTRIHDHLVNDGPGFTRNVSDIGHFGTGDLEIVPSRPNDLERADPLIRASYEASQPRGPARTAG